MILGELRAVKTELLQKIEEKAEAHAAEIRVQCDQLREECKNAVDQANVKVAAPEARVFSLEEAENGHSDTVIALQQEVVLLKQNVTKLEERNEALEARSHRCNLRITGIKERREHGKRATLFHDC